jgi:hypothetical protein
LLTAYLMQLAAEVAVHADALLSALRVAALQGELSSHSAAPSAERGSVPENVEHILMRIAVMEDCSLAKLRGWLLRVPSVNPFGNAYQAAPKQLQQQQGLSRSSHDGDAPSIRAHFGAGDSSGRQRGWDVRPPPRQSSGGGIGEHIAGRSARSAIDAARW